MKTVINTSAGAQTKIVSPGWLAAWLIASGVGFTLGVFGSLNLIWSLGERASATVPALLQSIVGGGLFGLGVGFVIGLAQWVALRALGKSSPRWLLSTTLGGLVGGIVIGTFLFGQTNNGSNPVFVIGGFALLGGVIGGFNYLLSRETAASPVWIATSAVAMAVGCALLFGISNADIGWVTALAAGLLFGAVSTAGMWWNSK